MFSTFRRLCISALTVTCSCAAIAMPQVCEQSPLTIQVLGSGAADLNGGRAQSGYVVWQNGHSRLLFNAGSSAVMRFGQAGAKIEELDLIALASFRTDYAAGLPPLLQSAYYSARRETLPISGPAASSRFPNTTQYLKGMFDAKSGLYRYLAGFIDGSDGLFPLKGINIKLDDSTPTSIIERGDYQVKAIGSKDPEEPVLAYQLNARNKKISFVPGQIIRKAHVREFVTNSDILITNFDRNAGVTPSSLAKLANDAKVKNIMVSHLNEGDLQSLSTALTDIKSQFKGEVIVAEDLQCLQLSENVAVSRPAAPQPERLIQHQERQAASTVNSKGRNFNVRLFSLWNE